MKKKKKQIWYDLLSTKFGIFSGCEADLIHAISGVCVCVGSIDRNFAVGKRRSESMTDEFFSTFFSLWPIVWDFFMKCFFLVCSRRVKGKTSIKHTRLTDDEPNDSKLDRKK